jgi:molybdopterin molybdotransferase
VKTPLAPEPALALVLERVQPLEAELVPIGEALGRVLADDAVSSDDVPPFDSSAMDGYAVRAADTAGASAGEPVRLTVVGESRAGKPAETALSGGDAIRISTGAVLPPSADAVVRIEDCLDKGESVAVAVEVSPGKEVRRGGEDIRAGDLVIERGTIIGPAELGVLASVGATEVSCARRPRVTVLATGDELVEPGHPLGPGQIRNSNLYSVPSQVRSAGAQLSGTAVVPDDYESTVGAIAAALDDDVVIVCGGVSVGPHDHVKPAFEALGVEEVFWGVALRPGHPIWFGIKNSGFSLAGKTGSSEGSTLVFGLPGNPVSAMVTFHLFVRPALAALVGAAHDSQRTTATMDEAYRKQPGRAHVVRCRLELRPDGWHVRPTKEQSSHVLTSMLGARALALLEVDRGDVTAGELVEIELL